MAWQAREAPGRSFATDWERPYWSPRERKSHSKSNPRWKLLRLTVRKTRTTIRRHQEQAPGPQRPGQTPSTAGLREADTLSRLPPRPGNPMIPLSPFCWD